MPSVLLCESLRSALLGGEFSRPSLIAVVLSNVPFSKELLGILTSGPDEMTNVLAAPSLVSSKFGLSSSAKLLDAMSGF